MIKFRHLGKEQMNVQTSTVVALLLLASIGAAQAAIGPVTIIDGNYQQSTTTTSVTPSKPATCPAGTLNCYFLFSPVAAGKQLIVTHVVVQYHSERRCPVLGLYHSSESWCSNPQGTGPGARRASLAHMPSVIRLCSCSTRKNVL